MSYKIETNCVQGAYRPQNGEPRVLPIVQSTTFKYDTSEAMAKLFDLEPGYMYTRLANPTSDMVAQKITMLEGGVAGVLTSSGQAANFYSIFNVANCGDHVISSSAIYGGTFNLFAVTMKKMGIDVRRKLFNEILTAFGGNLKKIICGGAALNPKMIEFFENLGIKYIEGRFPLPHSPPPTGCTG